MKTLIWALLGVSLAFVVAVVLLILVELFSAVVHPTPPDFPGTMEAMCSHVARYPHGVLAVCMAMWGGIAWLTTWLAGRIGGRVAGGLFAVLLLAAMLWNVGMLPYHGWFKALCPLTVLAGCLGGLWWGRSRLSGIDTVVEPS
jgi:hypothetical protein